MRLETYKMATSILLKFLTLKCDISRTIWRIEVSDGLLFCIFHALSFDLNLFFDRTCPLRVCEEYKRLKTTVIGERALIDILYFFLIKSRGKSNKIYFNLKCLLFSSCLLIRFLIHCTIMLSSGMCSLAILFKIK